MKHKRFNGNILFGGCSFDVEFYAKNQKEASERIEVSLHHLKTFFSVVISQDDFPEIRCKPYGSKSIEAFPDRQVVEYEAMKIKVREHNKKKYKWND